MLFCHVTTHVDSDKYQDLLGRKGGGGWPYIVVMDAEGGVLAKHDGSGGPGTFQKTKGFERTVAEAEETAEKLAALGERAAGGDAAAAASLLDLEVDLRRVEPEGAKQRLAELEGILDDRRRAIDVKIVIMEVGAIQTQATEDPKTQYAVGKQFAAMVHEDRTPPDDEAMYFWYFTSIYAEKERDAALYGRALEGLKKHDRRLGPSMLRKMEETLKALEAEGGGDKQDRDGVHR